MTNVGTWNSEVPAILHLNLHREFFVHEGRQRFAEANKAEQVRALEVTLEETKQWPEVQQAFNDAFALFRQRKTGESPAKSK